MEERIQKIVERWYLTEGALFQIFCTHDLAENAALHCPMRSGKGKIEYAPDKIAELSDAQLELSLKAEVIRILLKHPYGRQPDGCKRASMAAGSNLVLADNYDFSKIGMETPAEMGLRGDESYEWYSYRVEEHENGSKLTDNPKTVFQADFANDEGKGDYSKEEKQETNNEKQGKTEYTIGIGQGNDSSDKNKGGSDAQEQDSGGRHNHASFGSDSQGSLSQPDENSVSDDASYGAEQPNDGKGTPRETETRDFDLDKGMEDLAANWEEDSLMNCTLDVVIDDIDAANNWGSLAGKVAQQVIANTKARIDYRKALAGFRASILSSKRKLTRMRPNRRTGFQNMGSIRRFDTHVLVAVDVSGSVTEQNLSHFFSIVNRAFKYGIERIETVYFDTRLSEAKTLTKAIVKEIPLVAGGGTSYQPLFDFVEEHPELDGLIVLTDGEAPVPDVPPRMRCKVVWVCPSQKSYDRNHEWMKRIGRCCVMRL